MEENGEKCLRITMRRKDTGQPWGFRMTGGKDLGCTLTIAKVNPRSLSARSGLRAGDTVVSIEKVVTTGLSHDEAKAEILRAGNDLHLLVRRGSAEAVEKVQEPVVERRSMVVEEETEYKGDPNPTSQSRTFHLLNQFLQDELEELSKKPEKPSKSVNGPKPASSSECAPVRGSAYPSARKAPAETTTEPPEGPAKEPPKASSDRTPSSPVKQPKDASAVASSEASPSKAMNTAAAASATKIGDAKTEKPKVVPKTGSVDVLANKFGAGSAAVSPGSKADKPNAVSKTGSADVKANISSADSAAVTVDSKAKIPPPPSAVESVSISESADTSVVISADAEVNSPAVVSADADVNESVSVEAPLTIVAIDDEADDADYSDGDYTGGSVSEGSDEAATFTIQM